MKPRSQQFLRLLSFAMALLMLVSMLPARVYAEGEAAAHEHSYERGVCTVDGCDESKLDEGWLVPDFPELADGGYSMVVIPDTQHLVYSHEQGYYNLMQWIADNKDERNIVAAMSMGDMVQNSTDAQYQICVNGTDILDESGIAWMPMRGNHDESAMFNTYFGYDKYGSGRSWFGGSYDADKLDRTYWFVTVGEREYMILSLGYAPDQDVLDWAAGVVEANPTKSVIITAHDVLNASGAFLGTGTKIWNTLGGYKNVIMCFGGHVFCKNLVKREDTNGAGNTVYSILVDAQSQDQVTDTNDTYWGMLAVLTFDKDGNTVAVNWYSTHYDAFYGEANQFTIQVPHVCVTHTYSDPVKVEATCTEQGGDQYTCTVCGYSCFENEVAPQGHSYGTPVSTAATCTERGYDTYTCTTCGSSYTDNYTNAAGHTIESWSEPTEATCTEAGVKTGTCTVCGETVAEEVSDALGHSYGEPVYTEYFGSKPGYSTAACTRCDYLNVELGTLVMSSESCGTTAGTQDGAIWNGKLFQPVKQICYVYDLETQTQLTQFTLDGTDSIVAHGNTSCFGSTYYAEGDKYPLLYVSVWKQYENQTDNMEGTCCVYRIIEADDGSFSSELVQVIRIGFTDDQDLWASTDGRPYGTFVVDTDENLLYTIVGRVTHSNVFAFYIPALDAGSYDESYGCNLVTLTIDDIRHQYDTEYVNYPQGASYHSGHIFVQESFGSTRRMKMIDLRARAVVHTHNMVAEGFSGTSSLLAFDPVTADLYYGLSTGNIYHLTFRGEDEDVPVVLYHESYATLSATQDGAIWNGKLFQATNGTCYVYDMATKALATSFTLENFGSIVPHGNSVNFGSTANLEEGEYPLLYVGLWSRTASENGSCCVYRIIENEAGSFSADLVQVIKVGFGNDANLWTSTYRRPYATYAVDAENNKLYAMVTRDTEPCNRVFTFDLPEATDGIYNETYGYYELTLTTEMVLDRFDVDPVYLPQGACYYEGKIYIQGSGPSENVPSVLHVIDLESQETTYSYVMGDWDIPEKANLICVDPADGAMYYGLENGSIYKLTPHAEDHMHTFAVTADPTCTAEGVITFTCACGDSYTEAIPANGHSYVDGLCEICGEKEPEMYQETYGKLSPKQDGAIWNGKLFQPTKGTCSVYDLAAKKTLVSSFNLDDTNGILAHGNTACFGSTYYADGDEYPLLYVSAWNQYKDQADRMEGTCCVYRITETDGVFSGELVQVIEIGFTEDLKLWKSLENNGDVRPYGAFVVDTDANVLYAMVMRDAEKQNRVFAFDIPDVTAGAYNESYGCNVVTLEQTDIKDQFDTEYINFQQGACYYNGKIYTQESFVQNNVPPVLKVIDLKTETVTHSYDMTEAGIAEQANLICVDPADGTMYYGVDNGTIYKLTPHAEGHMHTFAVTTDPTCTAEGVITYTCACGDSYTEAISENGHAIVDGKCEACGLMFYVAENTATNVAYYSASKALEEAVAGQTVRVLMDHTDSNLIVPADVILDMNGCVVTAKNVLSFGVVMDNQEDQTKVGGIKIDIDTTKAFTKLQPENGGYLPVYDSRDGMYKFFEYKLVNVGKRTEDGKVIFAFKIDFTNMEAYNVLADSKNSGMSLNVNLSWTGITVPYVTYQVSDDLVRDYARQVVASNSKGKVMTISVFGLENLSSGDSIMAAPILNTIAEVEAVNESITYQIS